MAEENNSLVWSFLAVRRALGILGLALPCVLAVVGLIVNGQIENSISAFYYTVLGDVFVGTLCAIGVFLFSYKGYAPVPGERLTDQRVAQAAGLGAVLTALVPTPLETLPTCDPACLITGLPASVLHFGSAVLFLGATAVFCFVLFTRTHPGAVPDQRKRNKNRFYRACGTVIVLMVVLLIVQFFIAPTGSALRQSFEAINLVFWLEALAVIAFGAAWLVKGKTLEALFGG